MNLENQGDQLLTHFEELKIDRETLIETAVPGVRYRNITPEVQSTVGFSKIKEGLVTVQAKHTTAALVVNEDERGLIGTDFPHLLRRLCPEGDYEHDAAARLLLLPLGEPKNAPAHLRSILGGRESLTLVVHNSSIQLGTWQAILFFDFDSQSHASRLVVIQVMGIAP